MVYSKKHFLAASVVILIIVGLATSLTGEDLIKERDACTKMLRHKFNNDVDSNLMTAYYTLDEDITTAIFKSLQTQGTLYEELNMPKVPLSNYLHDYMYHILTDMEIDMKVIADPVLFCFAYFYNYNVSCPQTLRLIGLPAFGKTYIGRANTLGVIFFYWTEKTMRESYTIRSYKKDYAITPTELSIEPKTIYFLKHEFVEKYYWYIGQILQYPRFADTDKLYNPDNFCTLIAVIDDADKKNLKSENDKDSKEDSKGTKQPEAEDKDNESMVVLFET